MLGTPTSTFRHKMKLEICPDLLIMKKGTTSRRKLKRLQSRSRAVEEDRSNGSLEESANSNLSTDESVEFSNLVASVKLSINRPPLADVIERPKSLLQTARVSPLAVSPTPLFASNRIFWSDNRVRSRSSPTRRSLDLSVFFRSVYVSLYPDNPLDQVGACDKGMMRV
jgi:hypothetical protein